MKYLYSVIISATVAVATLTSCHSIEEWDNDHHGNFDALWTILDEHYCFFEDKDVDWNEIGTRYRAAIQPDWTQVQFFDHCAAMLEELRDGHTNLSSWFDVSYYRKWWSDYPQNFDLRVIQQYYLGFDYHSGTGTIYKYLEDRKVGYVYYSTFAGAPSHSFIDMMLISMKDADGLIIDVRNNGGGDISNVGHWVSHFIDKKTLGGYISHKTGPGHNDFSEPYAFYYEPAEGHVKWFKPVIVLANRSTYSAANNFVSAMKQLPQVAVAGSVTGGGSGMPFSSELPCGWAVRFSASPVYDAQMQLTEHGVAPTPGAEIDMEPQLALDGTDTILEFAIDVLNRIAEENRPQESPARYLAQKHGKEL